MDEFSLIKSHIRWNLISFERNMRCISEKILIVLRNVCLSKTRGFKRNNEKSGKNKACKNRYGVRESLFLYSYGWGFDPTSGSYAQLMLKLALALLAVANANSAYWLQLKALFVKILCENQNFCPSGIELGGPTLLNLTDRMGSAHCRGMKMFVWPWFREY
jgi:hypothetical protein